MSACRAASAPASRSARASRLWEGFLPQWVGQMRETAPDISIRSEIGFEEDLMRRLVEGTLDIGLMYTPQHSPGLEVEHLFDETLVLLTTDPHRPWPDDGYVYVDWGPAFYAQHTNQLPRPGTAGAGGEHRLAGRAADPQQRRLLLPAAAHGANPDRGGPAVPGPRTARVQTCRPTWCSRAKRDSAVLGQALAGLRALAGEEQRKAENRMQGSGPL
jgi:DNA-binding transcriptional LysR family regulator